MLILFDLDGTLVDPEGAITGGIASALQELRLPVPSSGNLQRMVGPALVRSLVDIARVPLERVDEVVDIYRAGYRQHGMANSTAYPGIVDAVQRLKADGHIVAVATQKPEWLARELLDVQQMAPLFASVHGAPRDERAAALLDGKRTIIAAALAEHAGTYDAAVMVGDRSHDVHGAAANGLDCIAVSWGFGSEEEFSTAGPSAVVHSAEELVERVLEYAQHRAGEVAHGRL
ncbi:HAD hydrolase-like protein [Arthrobacter sp. JZ12]|nr:HAD hydrolase-like protein [Arthrobacter sp. JZ12]